MSKITELSLGSLNGQGSLDVILPNGKISGASIEWAFYEMTVNQSDGKPRTRLHPLSLEAPQVYTIPRLPIQELHL